MTNFILQDPDVVFVHLPRTGGGSVKTALGSRVAQRAYGHIPAPYANWARFAVVRDPKARFMSAFRAFKYGETPKEEATAPRWPELTITQALDLLEDPWIGFDCSGDSLPWNLKAQLIPQTHPFHGLSQVERILHYERLEADFTALAADLGVRAALPDQGKSDSPAEMSDPWTSVDEGRFLRLFAQDYAALGYEPEAAPGTPPHPPPAPPRAEPPPATVFDLWPAYHSDRTLNLDAIGEALPDPNGPLEPFVDSVIPGAPGRTWAARSKDLNDHFHKLQPEFGGATRLSHLLACVIVVIRRDPAYQPAQHLFWRIMDEQFDAIQADLSLRWLISIADTIADFGRDAAERATGLAAASLANTCRLYESELAVFYPQRPWPPKARVAATEELFDGLRSFRPEQGDMIETMFARTSEIAELSPVAGKVQMEVLERLRKGPTVIRRFNRILGQAPAPVVDEEVKARLQRIMRRRL